MAALRRRAAGKPGRLRRVAQVLFALLLVGMAGWILLDLDRRADRLAHASLHVGSGFAPPAVHAPHGIAVEGGYTEQYPGSAESFTAVVSAARQVDPPEVRTFRDRVTCGDTVWPYVSGGGPTGMADAFVWLEGVTSGMGTYATSVSLSNSGCSLWPHVSIAGVGSTVYIENYLYSPEVLRVSAMDGGSHGEATQVTLEAMDTMNYVATSETITLDTPGLVRIQSMLRPWEIAFVLVCEHAYCGTTDWEGRFLFASVPPGTYTLHAWHHLTGETTRTVEVKPGIGAADVAIQFP